MDCTIFQERLGRLMESRGFTMRSLAEEIGITPSTLSRYLSTNRVPDLAYVVKLAEYFNVSVDWLIGLNGDHFDILPKEIQDVAFLYSLATEDDRRVVQAVLNKYKTKE